MRERIKEVMANVFGVPVSDVPDDPSMDGFSEWDSLRHIELMLALEMEFDVHFSTAAMLQISSLQAIEDYLVDQAVASTG